MDPVMHFEMPAKDMQRAKDFYEHVFNWRIDAAFDSYFYAQTAEDTGGNHMSQSLGAINGAIQRKDDTIGTLRLCIRVNDISKSVQIAEEHGGRILFPPKKIPGMLYAIILDPEGNELNLVEPIQK
jgi:predicted enzyme related to lactoylglutathione lyase